MNTTEKTTTAQAPAGAVAIRSFGAEELVTQMDSQAAAAAIAKEIEVRAILAERNPRNLKTFYQNLMSYCDHPVFAESALYCRKVGGRKQNAVTGAWEDNFAINFSIRFIEAALPIYQHMFDRSSIVREDDNRIVISVQVYDAQNNTGYEQEATLPKLVERREHAGRVVRGERMTSENNRVWIVEATKDEMRNVIGAERSKIRRDLGQKLLPFHMLIDARAHIDKTNADTDAKDPGAAMKKVLLKFSELGITADKLEAYLGRSLETLNIKDLAELAVLYNGLREGEVTWADIMRSKDEPPEGVAGPAPQADPRQSSLRDKILTARAGTQKPDAPPSGDTGGGAQ